MVIIEPSVFIETDLEGDKILKDIEKAGRTCYKSENLITSDSAKEFVKKILASGHESVIEHCSITVRIICDRGVTHEIVRHRIASYSQESTRYCNYSKQRFGSGITYIKPCFWQSGADEDNKKIEIWKSILQEIEKSYLLLIELGALPEEARSILPNSLKTEIVMTMNLREWRHFLKLRCSPTAHPQMKEIATMILKKFKEKIPVIFDDIDSSC